MAQYSYARIVTIMQTRQWIKEAQLKGWRLASVSGLSMRLECSKHGCSGHKDLPLDNLGPVPEPCDKPHVQGYSQSTFDEYSGLVGELRRRRRQLGLDQTDLNAAMGVTDGYVNKLESLARVATFPTLQLWAQTLGLSISTAPAPLPPATLRAIEYREAKPYQPNQARYKHD
jgi:hypothetical protein